MVLPLMAGAVALIVAPRFRVSGVGCFWGWLFLRLVALGLADGVGQVIPA
jgi:hypothetical protein